MRTQTFAIAVLAALAVFIVFTGFERLHEGRCRIGGGGGGGGRSRSAINCTYPAGTFPAWPRNPWDR